MRLAAVALALCCWACGNSPTEPTIPPFQLITETMSGQISGGDRPCDDGSQACSMFSRTITHSGRIDAELAWNRNDAVLGVYLYEAVSQSSARLVASGGNLVWEPLPSNIARVSFNANVNPGRFEFRVKVLQSTSITTFTLATTHPN